MPQDSLGLAKPILYTDSGFQLYTIAMIPPLTSRANLGKSTLMLFCPTAERNSYLTVTIFYCYE